MKRSSPSAQLPDRGGAIAASQGAEHASPPNDKPCPKLPKRFVHPLTKENIVVCSKSNLIWGEKEAARLETTKDGVKQILALQLDRPFIVGRAKECDYVVSSKYASGRHLRLLAHTTDSGHMFVSCEDLSSNGLVWNGRKLSQAKLLLGRGDIIEIPRCQAFAYRHLKDDPPPSPTKDGKETQDGEKATNVKKMETPKARKVGHRYTIMSRILGTGSFSQVYLAWDEKQKKQIACKRQSLNKTERQDSINMERELIILSKLRHPNINSVIEWIQEESWLYLFIEIVTGSDLFNWTLRQGRATEGEATFIAYQLLLALAFLHEKKIAHRDVKPENVLLLSAGTRFPHVQLADFGLSWEENAIPTVDPGAGVVALSPRAFTQSGTVAYQPPEFHMSAVLRTGYNPFLDDSWALGCTIALVLLGLHPFDQSGASPGADFTFYVQEHLLDEGVTTREELEAQNLWIEEKPPDKGGNLEGEADDKAAKRNLVRRIFEGLHWKDYPEELRPSLEGEGAAFER